jgi:DNA-binding MarR family transcriptional regulator
MPRRSPAGRRRVLVNLIPAGQAVLDRVLPEVQQLVTAVMGTPTTRPSTPCWTT